jgi:hypothetical protein
MVDVASSSWDLAVVEKHGTITDLTLKPLSQTALALRALGPSPNRLGIIGQKLDHARKRPPPPVDSLLATLMALLVFVTCRPTGLAGRNRIRWFVRRIARTGRVGP